ncbi:MAG: ATP-binding protein, partial [Rhodospirillales bacterium]|nr:ATP-binding protein [Rhodospirillales bacterium]
MESFKQLHALGLNSNEGTDLGLTLTKKLVKAHGGKLEMESEPAVGTTVK